MSSDSPFDPYQVFEVNHQHCAVVYVRVVRGRKITKGWAKDLVDTPDPYVILTLAKSPQAWRKTTVKDNDVFPEWDETFCFWLNPDEEHTLEMSLMDANYTVDEHLATRTLDLNPLPLEKKLKKTIYFNETSEVDIEVWGEIIETPDLRYSLTLCQEEKNYIEVRKKRILKALKQHYGFAAPRHYREVPVLGIMGSGGGFRALTAYSGVMTALSEMGVLDMTMYAAGLSGSAWYLSQLYSHRQWPSISPGEQRAEIRSNIDHSFLWLFRSHGLTFVKEVWKKRSRGEPVSFTDLFGHLVGNTLMKDRLDSKLSDQRQTVGDGQCPFPLYTCLHVKKAVSAMIFHEWMEFTPYEIGLSKYGTYMPSHQFASKYFMGSIIREFPEPPLHFLQGIWGSAFCIQFKRLLQDDKNISAAESIQREREDFEAELKKDMEAYDEDESESSDDENPMEKGTHGEKTTGGLQRKRSKSTKMKQKTFWDSMLTRMMESRWFQSIELRAAQVFNFMRGLSMENVFPFSPFTQTQEEEDENNRTTFGSIFDLHPTHVKKLYVVDSGLTFNSPYPVLLRPQREVDIILSFDFSARPTDDTPPFKELLLAAKWAELNKVPFPPIDPSIVQKEGLKECYVFKHPWDPNCPIVLHFCLVNINFRRELKPGVPRSTQEELDFGNFSVFDDPNRPYSTFKFTYSHLEFDRLSQLMEYNTLLHRDTIFDNISTCIKRRRRFSIRRPCKKADIARLSLNSRLKADRLEAYIAMAEKVAGEAQKEEDKDSLDIRPRAESGKPRPLSSPVKLLAEMEEMEKQAEMRALENVKNSKLQRSAVSLRSYMGQTRHHGRLGLDGLGEEKIEEQEEPPASPNPSSNNRKLLMRSRPVSASMKPQVSKIEENYEPETVSVVVHEENGKSENGSHDDIGSSNSSSSGSGSKSQNGVTIANGSDGSGSGAGGLVVGAGAGSSQVSVDTLGTNGSDSQSTQPVPSPRLKKRMKNQDSKDNNGSSASIKPLEEWIDAADRVTDL